MGEHRVTFPTRPEKAPLPCRRISYSRRQRFPLICDRTHRQDERNLRASDARSYSYRDGLHGLLGAQLLTLGNRPRYSAYPSRPSMRTLEYGAAYTSSAAAGILASVAAQSFACSLAVGFRTSPETSAHGRSSVAT